MLSDESSSDSETGRFKCRTKTQDEQKKSLNENRDTSRFSGRSRPSGNDRFRREFDKRRDERDRYDRRSRDRHRYSRHSPVRHTRRRHSRERSPSRRSRERERPRVEEREKSKPKDNRSNSRERRRHSKSKHTSPELKKDLRDEEKNSKSDLKDISSREKSTDKFDRRAREKSSSSSPEFKGKRSAVHVPTPTEVQRKKTESPVVVEEHVESEVEVQPGSYYSMIPAVVKEKSEESSEIDSSDDEKLRAKLLNSEKESHKAKKKKQKKKHKRKSSKSSKDRDKEPATMEVTSTTDIDKAVEETQPQAAEVTSTEKTVQKESSEEGEISSDDDDSQPPVDIDPTDLRHKLKRSKLKSGENRDGSAACGPALPPHLARNSQRSSSREIEGPALPPHLQRQSGSIGPSIPDDMRKVLADRETHIVYESSEEDEGIGPIPAGSEKWSEGHQRLEERALDLKMRRLDGHSLHKSDTRAREQWMLELPEGKAKYLGLEARSFRAREGPDMSDRSSWTDTPEQKARKAAGAPREEDAPAALQREARARHIAARDDEQEHAVKKHKKKHKREESLLEIHQKKLKKKKKKEERESKERRPFSRDVDLQVNRFDEAQKKSVIKKAQELNTRFGRGEAKYL